MATNRRYSLEELQHIAECIKEASAATIQTANLNFNSQGMRILKKRKNYDLCKFGSMHKQLVRGRDLARKLVKEGEPYMIIDGEILGLEYDYRLNIIDVVNFLNPHRFDPNEVQPR